MNNIDLTSESKKDIRDELVENFSVLEKMEALKTIKDHHLFSTKNLAYYFEVAETTISSVVSRNYDEFKEDESTVYKSDEIKTLIESYPYLDISSKARSVRIFSKKGLLRIGMLLKRSKIANELRGLLTLSITNKNALVPVVQEEQLSFYSFNNELKEISEKEAVEADLFKAYVNKLEIAGFDGVKAKGIALDCVISKKDINVVIKKLLDKKVKFNFNVNSSIFNRYMIFLAKEYFNEQYNRPYHVFSSRFIDFIGFDIYKKRIKDGKEKTYSDYIEEYDLWDEAIQVCQQIVDEYSTNK